MVFLLVVDTVLRHLNLPVHCLGSLDMNNGYISNDNWIMKCFGPSVRLGHGDLVCPHIWKSEIISLFSRNITVIENLF